jgi:anhydro-N-acetylmuramic acid kinase
MSKLRKLTVLGLNSGTSMDGIDAAIFRIFPLEEKLEINAKRPAIGVESLHGELIPFDPIFREHLGKLIGSGQTSLKEICLLNAVLGELFAHAALTTIKGAGLTTDEIDLIGSHGLTVWHNPEADKLWGVATNGTLQLGEPSIIRERTGIPVVADFRPADMAAGGQGAPLVAFADQVLFSGNDTPCGVLNLGGIANITVIDASSQATMAFDSGPANAIIDYVCQLLFGLAFDNHGAIAARGKINEEWLSALLRHPYFARKPPKTTGRELFGQQFAQQAIDAANQMGISPEDTMTTLAALTGKSVAAAYADFIQPQISLKRLIVGGGGAENKFLISLIKKYWPHDLQVFTHEDFGISSKFKEALLFALLAYTSYFGIPNNVPACTGAKEYVCLGKVIGVTGRN